MTTNNRRDRQARKENNFFYKKISSELCDPNDE
jgi:hypothetical protein